jgi:hypothetical protein
MRNQKRLPQRRAEDFFAREERPPHFGKDLHFVVMYEVPEIGVDPDDRYIFRVETPADQWSEIVIA